MDSTEITSQVAASAMADNSSAMDETQLIRRIQAGEKEEFRHLISAYKNLVFAMIMRQTADAILSEELSQEVFIKAYLGIGKFRFQSAFATWLTRIAINQVNTYFSSRSYREQRRTDEFKLKEHQAILQSDGQAEPDTVSNEEKLKRLRLAVAGLKQIYRDVIVLCALEKNSYEHAAEVLQIPVGTVRSRLNKARLLLAQALKNEL